MIMVDRYLGLSSPRNNKDGGGIGASLPPFLLPSPLTPSDDGGFGNGLDTTIGARTTWEDKALPPSPTTCWTGKTAIEHGTGASLFFLLTDLLLTT